MCNSSISFSLRISDREARRLVVDVGAAEVAAAGSFSGVARLLLLLLLLVAAAEVFELVL